MAVAPWAAEYSNHPVWTHISSTLDLIDQNIEKASDDDRDRLQRIRTILSAFQPAEQDPSPLVSTQMLNDLASTLQGSVMSPLQQWVNNPASNTLPAALNGMDQFLNYAKGWPVTKDRTTKTATESLKQVIEEANEELESFKQKSTEELGQLSTSIDGLINRLQQITTDVDQKTSTFNSEVSAASAEVQRLLQNGKTMETRLEEVLRSQNQSFTNSETQRGQVFNDAETKRANEFSELTTTLQGEFDTALKDFIRSWEESQVKAVDQAEQLMASLRKLEKEARDVVGATARVSTSTGYGKYADEQRRTANILRFIAITLFIAAFILIAYFVHEESNNPDSWKVTVMRATVSVTVLAAAGYVIRESNVHRTEQLKAKAVQLKLLAMGPFIANLPEHKQQHLTEQAATVLFVDKEPAKLVEMEVNE